MNELTERKSMRDVILGLQAVAEAGIASGELEPGEYPVQHYFTPIDEKYGCCMYARPVFLPKGHVVFGKIHKHPHLNFLMKGKISILTERGKHYFTAPCILVSEAGIKKAAYVEEDTIWVTVHLTEHHGEEKLEAVENEVIAKSYEELDLIESTKRLEVLE